MKADLSDRCCRGTYVAALSGLNHSNTVYPQASVRSNQGSLSAVHLWLKRPSLLLVTRGFLS